MFCPSRLSSETLTVSATDQGPPTLAEYRRANLLWPDLEWEGTDMTLRAHGLARLLVATPAGRSMSLASRSADLLNIHARFTRRVLRLMTPVTGGFEMRAAVSEII